MATDERTVSEEPGARELSDKWAAWAFAGVTRFYKWSSKNTPLMWEELDFDEKKSWCNSASIMPALTPPVPEQTMDCICPKCGDGHQKQLEDPT